MEMTDCSLGDEGWRREREDKQSGHRVVVCHEDDERVLKDGAGRWESRTEGAKF